MRLKIALLLACCVYLVGCTKQDVNLSLPTGITLLPEIDSIGLDFPIWSPDGKYIVAAYNIWPMSEFCFGCSTPRSEMVLIDPETWKTSTILTQESFNVQLTALSWSPDSKTIAIYYWDSIHENGNYTIAIEDPKPQFLMKYGELSHDWKRVITSASENSLKIMDLQSYEQQEIALPDSDSFGRISWSTDDQQLALIQRKNEKDHFDNIFVLDLESGELNQFTNDEVYYKNSPEFSPSGKIIAYGIRRFTDNGIESKVVISRLDRSCEWTIPLDNLDYFTWSPNSKKMFLIGKDGAYIADLEKVFGESFMSDGDCQ